MEGRCKIELVEEVLSGTKCDQQREGGGGARAKERGRRDETLMNCPLHVKETKTNNEYCVNTPPPPLRPSNHTGSQYPTPPAAVSARDTDMRM